MGKGKYDNEDLMKLIWLHVDKLSSAPVCLRLHKGEKTEDIPKEVLMDCALLVKANRLPGCEMNITVEYTAWSDLRKAASMDVGQIVFHRQKDMNSVTWRRK